MKTAVIDLDHTIFDAEAFKGKCLAKFFGMSSKDFKEYYEKHKKENGSFSPAELLRSCGLDMDDFKKFLAGEINRYLKPGAEKFLSTLKRNCDKLVLASFGNEEFQRLKIEHLQVNGIPFRQFFDEVIIEEKDKASNEALRSLKGDEIIFINDKPDENDRMAAHFGERGKFYLMRSRYSEDPKLGAYEDLDHLGRELLTAEYEKHINEFTQKYDT